MFYDMTQPSSTSLTPCAEIVADLYEALLTVVLRGYRVMSRPWSQSFHLQRRAYFSHGKLCFLLVAHFLKYGPSS